MVLESGLGQAISAHHRRKDLLNHLQELSDVGLQNRLWIDGESYPNAAGIDEVIHFLFDDTDIAKSPNSEIGFSLKNEQEANALSDLGDALGSIIDQIGDKGSSTYMSDPQWPHIVSLAGDALRVLALSET